MTRTRFAPSPTGYLHIGSLRTAAYAYAVAKHEGGQFLLRIEDTDQQREVEGAAEKIFSTLQVFGLHWDETPVVQSQRAATGVYIQAAEKLVASGHAFYCQCDSRNAKKEGYSEVLRDPCRDMGLTSGAIKLKVPDGEIISYHDYVLDKEVSWKSDTVADTTLLKSEALGRLPTYHLAVVVDDTDSRITHVLRGHDWQPSTPIHLYVYKFLGLEHPHIGHLTDILSPDGGKLSKRKGNVSCEQFLELGYLPEAILNFVILLGWAPKDNRELYTLSEFVEAFTAKGFQKANPMFSDNKLNWLNGHYIRQKTDEELFTLTKPYFNRPDSDDDLVKKIIPLVKDRAVTLADFPNSSAFFFDRPTVDQSLYPDPTASAQHIAGAKAVIEKTDWIKEAIDPALVSFVESQGWKKGDFFMSLRIAVCGSKFTPPLTDTMLILGKDETLARLS